MKLKFCADCGARDDLQYHHLVTRAEHGSDDETNLITLCHPCHAKLHERRLNGVYNASQRTKAGLEAAKRRGVVLGSSRVAADANKAAAAARDAGLQPLLIGLASRSYREIAAELTKRGVEAPRGGAWNQVSVMRTLQRLGLRS